MSTFWKPNIQTRSWNTFEQPELYHHGVKGMKWGKHLFGFDNQQQAGGGGAADEEDLKLFEKLKELYGESKARQMFREMKQKAKEKAQTIANDVKSVIPEKKIHEKVIKEKQIPEKKIHEKVIKEKQIPEKKTVVPKEKIIAKGHAVDSDARNRAIAEGRDRYRQNGKYRNMNLTDVYGENSKVNDRSGRDGINLFKNIDVDNIHDGKNYSTRDFDTSKYNDGRYSTRDKIREKITGVADPDNLKNAYNGYVRDFERRADQRHAFSVGTEEEFVRDSAREWTDYVENRVMDKSLAGFIQKRKSKRKRRR